MRCPFSLCVYMVVWKSFPFSKVKVYSYCWPYPSANWGRKIRWYSDWLMAKKWMMLWLANNEKKTLELVWVGNTAPFMQLHEQYEDLLMFLFSLRCWFKRSVSVLKCQFRSMARWSWFYSSESHFVKLFYKCTLVKSIPATPKTDSAKSEK